MMRKLLLPFLFLLLPFFGFAQSDFVQWNGTTDLKPTFSNINIDATDFTGAGFTNGNPTPSNDGIEGTNWPNGSLDYTKYFQIAVNPIANSKITIDQLLFTYKGNSKSYEVRYSKQADFSNPITLQTETNAKTNNSNNAITLSNLGIVLNPGERIYIRFYAGNGSGTWKIMNNTLKVRGTVNTNATALNGPYKIGSANDANFSNITRAVNALNQLGVSGPVIFNISENQIITSTLVINQFSGTSTTNTVTIKPSNSANITLSGSIKNGALIALNGADNIIIDGNNTDADNKLKIYNDYSTGAYDNRLGIWLYGGANGNTIKNLTIQLNILGRTIDVYSTGILAGGSSIGNSGNNSNNTVSNVTFTEVKQPITVLGDNNTTNWTITKNTIGGTTVDNQPLYGMSLNNVNGFTISNNTISGVSKNANSTTNLGGVMISGSSTNGAIYANTIFNIVGNIYNNGSKAAGIYVNSSSTTSKTSIYNNFISRVSTPDVSLNNDNYHNKAHGIFIESGNINVYYNTIVMNNQSSAAYSSCLYITGGTGFNINNNIFYNKQPNGTQLAVFLTVAASAISSISNNDYYVTSATDKFSNRLGARIYVGDTDFQTWKTTTFPSDTSPRPSILPTFEADNDANPDYRLKNVSANNTLTGAAITGIVTDYFNSIRVKPYIGAHELNGCTPVGNQIAYGQDSWIGYVYSSSNSTAPNPATNLTLPIGANMSYIGRVEEPQLFNRDIIKAAVTGVNPQLCGTPPSNNFFVRYKMKTTVATTGTYNITVGADDLYRLYINDELVIDKWSGVNYTQRAINKILTAGTEYRFDIEYYEDTTDSRIQFSMGLIAGANNDYPFGENLWKVYGFTNAIDNNTDFSLTSDGYAGYYSTTPVNINTVDSFNTLESPSFNPAVSGWQGAPVPKDYFILSYKRRGFPCGAYKIEIAHRDNNVQIYLNEDTTNPIFTGSYFDKPEFVGGGTGTTYNLNKDSEIEIRLKDYKDNAQLTINFIPVETIYTGSGPVPNTTAITIASNTTLQSDLEVCSCTIKPGVTLTVPSNKTLTVNQNITVGAGGKLLLENNASLLQTNVGADAYTGDFDSFVMQRNTSPVRRYDFTNWSSPIYSTPAFTLHDVSPLTLADKYYSYDPTKGWIISYNGVLPMVPGMGYIVRAPQTYDITNSAIYTATFTGKPNNGTIQVTAEANKYITVGNPYPSAVDAKAFIDINHNAGVDIGSLYFWTHNSPPVNSIPGDKKYHYNTADYAVFNKTGGTKGSNTGANSKAPTGFIAAAASFFIKPTGTDIKFTNDMRVGGENDQFYKNTNKSNEEKNRLWLNFANTEGAFKQALIGYMDGATNDRDYNYDASTFNGNEYVDFYSINGTFKFTIQARALPFNDSDLVPLGYVSKIVGDFTISIEEADGFFDTQAVYLEDKNTGKITDLRAGNYTFATEKGTFDDRFVLRYTNKTLGTGDFENIENGLLVSVKDKVIKVTSAKENIKEVTIFDINGKQLHSKNKIGSTELLISALQAANQVLLVKVTLENEFVVTKKILFQ